MPKKKKSPSKKKPAAKKKSVKRAAKKKSPAKTKAKPAPKASSKAKRKPAKRAKSAAQPAPVLPWRQPLPGETLVGVVEDYLSHLSVIILTLQKPLSAGDRLHVRGHTTDVSFAADSLQVEHRPVSEAPAGAGVGLKAPDKCRAGDYVYKSA